ncbi:hypothetical protein LTS18_009591, partial [Coniosporium uncinatum]
STINYYWSIDRTYLVMANAPVGGCTADKRGPTQDVVVSSVEWYKLHGNTSPADVITNTEATFFSSEYSPAEFILNGKILPGSFTIPVLNNPGGEAISSIFQTHSRNYPCMAGAIEWNSGKGHPGSDELQKFLQATGYYGSLDWYQQCAHRHKCEKDRSRSFTFRQDAFRTVKEISHPWKKCAATIDHSSPFVGKNDEGYRQDE